MGDTALHEADTRRCPVCEYDLRGNVSGRCPECGSPVLSAASSRLPWIYQQARGGIRAYIQTVALLLFKPAELAREASRRVARKPARRFHQESLILATILSAGFLAIIFLLRGPRWEARMTPSADFFFRRSTSLLILPIFVWTDRLSILIPSVPVIYFSLRISAWFYRLFFRIGPGAADLQRRRAARIAYYGTGLAPIILSVVGVITLASIVLAEEWNWALGGWRPLVLVLTWLLTLAAPVLFYFPTLTLMNRAGGISVPRCIAMLLGFPIIAAVVTIAVSIFIFWITGYIVMAVWAMTH